MNIYKVFEIVYREPCRDAPSKSLIKETGPRQGETPRAAMLYGPTVLPNPLDFGSHFMTCRVLTDGLCMGQLPSFPFASTCSHKCQ